MHTEYSRVAQAFESLEKAIDASTAERRPISEVTPGWNSPAVDRMDLVQAVRDVADLFIERAPDDFDEEDQGLVETYVLRLKALESQTVPYLFNGNGAGAVPTLMLSLQAMSAWINSIWPADEKLDPSTFPFRVARRARAARARLDETDIDVDHLRAQIALIAEAHQAAESLPADLEDLKAARARLASTNEQALSDSREITKTLGEVERLAKAAAEAQTEAEGYAKKASEAYRFTTSHGLAQAFDERSRGLAGSMWVWVFGLLCALVGVAVIGHNRVAALTAIVAASEPSWGTVAINLVLSIISVGAPLWFAWVATKQIGQRFRLAEDYAFKASVAKAYEGYRREAISIDKAFEAQLFGIALDRMREAPLRLVEQENHGSPWHELLTSQAVNEARGKFPDLPQRITDFVRAMVQKSSSAKPATPTE